MNEMLTPESLSTCVAPSFHTLLLLLVGAAGVVLCVEAEIELDAAATVWDIVVEAVAAAGASEVRATWLPELFEHAADANTSAHADAVQKRRLNRTLRLFCFM
ncbi:hypothetical protein ABIA31_009386 [Catenulispora sp. MAP5-51]|uniref:hypothetical protein n=1 Tax=Catenulispora sp. MAP5-51 TaxID=3156298 RepID=UPI00351501EC